MSNPFAWVTPSSFHDRDPFVEQRNCARSECTVTSSDFNPPTVNFRTQPTRSLSPVRSRFSAAGDPRCVRSYRPTSVLYPRTKPLEPPSGRPLQERGGMGQTCNDLGQAGSLRRRRYTEGRLRQKVTATIHRVIYSRFACIAPLSFLNYTSQRSTIVLPRRIGFLPHVNVPAKVIASDTVASVCVSFHGGPVPRNGARTC